ncbi:homeobox vent1-like protein [Labeo rohita]|uniref:Homeobox vent1-like protein n=2 Tax=Labeo rohita TaxID=84645 RepID=A0A498LML2_LABRO|nr:ventral homeobox [Labeo rohita]KAI2658150.1 Homeobox protein vent1 [Labeo rohita]RXN09390.1 homeobox vent1-like protein [Labeo rohita]
MVKKFSVDWLAQSFHDSASRDVPEPEKKTHRPHVPCLVQPRPPTSYDKVYLQPKPKVNKVEQTPEIGKEVTTPVTQRNCSSPSFSENSGYSSGYESEAATSECASVEDANEMEKDAATRRIRTKFTPEQIDKLEKIFNKHKYLDAGERVKTALKLSLSETQVRTWFQNRRMKLKREVQEMRADYLLPQMVLPHVLPVQYHCYDRQRLPFPPHGALMQQMMQPQPLVPHHHQLMMPRQHYY